MAIRLDQFAKRLVDSGLISADEVAAIVSALPAERQSDAEALARELVRSRRLTAFQVQEAYQGRGKGLVLGNYVVLDKLGQGGMGMVLKAEHRRMERLVALKILSPSVTKSPEIVARFQREVKAAAKLNHPNIVTAYDADEAGGTHFLVMEYVEGTDLSALVKKNGPLPLDRALHCVMQAARGLEYAHGRGVVHRDIKPANLLLDRDGTVKILDMGLARLDSAGEQQDELTGSGQIMGTVDYMAPEQALSTKSADRRADIYSLGITLWYLLCGRPAYEGDSALAKLLAHRERPIPSLRDVCSAAPPALDAVFARMVAKTPEARYQTMTQVIADLERGGTGREEPPSQTAAPGEDSRLSEFLRGLEQSEDGRGRAKAVLAQATAHIVSEETLSRIGQPGDTDPTTEQSLGRHRTRLLGRTKGGPSWMRRLSLPTTRRSKLLVGGVAALLLLAGIVGLWQTNRGTVRVAEGDSLLPGGTSPADIEPSSTAQASGGRQPSGDSVPGPSNPSGDNSSDWKGWPADAPAPAIAPFDAAQARQHQQAWANHLGVPVEYTNSIGMRFRLIPPGEFMMGSTAEEVASAIESYGGNEMWIEWARSEGPQHHVRLTQPWYLGVHKVTQKQYTEVMGTNPSSSSVGGAEKGAVAGIETDAFPVDTVSWNDAAEFCARLSLLESRGPYYARDGESVMQLGGAGYRLATESEWEFAARGGTTTRFWSGDSYDDLLEVDWSGVNSGGRAHAVGELPANPLGLFDVHGTVFEWCQDAWTPAWFAQFRGKSAVDPIGPSEAGLPRTFRGGLWNDSPRNACVSRRRASGSDLRDSRIGMRVALSVDAVKQAHEERMASAARYEHALEFDGLDDFVELPTLTFDNTRPFTLELWAEVRNPDQEPLLTQLSGVPSRRGKLQVITAKGLNSLRGEVYADLDGAVGDTVPYQQMISPRSFLAGLLHAALCWDPAGTVTLYENGRLVSTTNSQWNLARPPGQPSTIGSVSAQARKSWLQGRVWRARLSNVIRYREDFTPTADWEPDAETVALYRFGDAAGDVLTDASGNGHHGKIVGASWVTGDEKPLAPAIDPFAVNRQAAEWVLARGGKLTLQNARDGKWPNFGPDKTELPTTPFVLRVIDVRDGKVTSNLDLDHFIGCRHLQLLTLTGAAIDNLAVEKLATLPMLGFLVLSHSGDGGVTTSGLAPLTASKSLNSLAITSEMVDDDLAAVAQLPSLRSLNIYGRHVPDLRRLAEAPELRVVHLPIAEAVDPQMVETLQAANPRLRIVMGHGAASRALGHDPVAEAARHLLALGIELPASSDGYLPRKPLTAADLDATHAWIAYVEQVPSSIQLTAADREMLMRMEMYHFTAESQHDADDLAENLATNHGLASVNVARSDLTDAGLAHLRRLVGLRALNVAGTKVSQAGVDAFHRNVPACYITSDFGVIPADLTANPIPREWTGWPADTPTNVATTAGAALQFDGQSGHVHVPTLSRDDAGPMTIEAWVRPEVQQGHKAVALLSGQHPLQINTFNDRLYALSRVLP